MTAIRLRAAGLCGAIDGPLPILGILGALLLGAMSPGPSFIFVVRTSLAASRRAAVAAAVGMGLGGVVYAGLAMLGLTVILEQAPALHLGLRVVGGAYLLYLAYRLWSSAKQPLEVSGAAAAARPMAMALLAQLSNPKTALVYASTFAALMPGELSLAWRLGLPVLVFLVEAGWYSVVALVFCSAPARAAYARGKVWVDRSAGGAMGALGLLLMLRRQPVP